MARRPARHVVEVDDALVIATGHRADWWAWLLIAHHGTGRIREVAASIGGAICHVTWDSREHATQLTESMVTQHGLPRAAVKAKAVPHRHDR
ncbi:hypothetical protein [Micromonospora sp. WMMD1082]|uniref:hypothetical protein n=1 Tax=Micromonospora sp. WMMD1082 TaxID=3016104 RepID=UPI002416EC68|nr:hypothetical protein [Micromonospora sp. WMMD1082]MDG4795420.1 hypothetical protein [Micromonospora sp. WMMD1082]